MSTMAIGLERRSTPTHREPARDRGGRVHALAPPDASVRPLGAEPSCPAITTPGSVGSTSPGTSSLSRRSRASPSRVEVLSDLVPKASSTPVVPRGPARTASRAPVCVSAYGDRSHESLIDPVGV